MNLFDMIFPENSENGHRVSCRCSYCANELQANVTATRERRSRGVGGHTVLDIILDSLLPEPLPPGSK